MGGKYEKSIVYTPFQVPLMIARVPRDYAMYAFAASAVFLAFKGGFLVSFPLLGILWCIGMILAKDDPEFCGIFLARLKMGVTDGTFYGSGLQYYASGETLKRTFRDRIMDAAAHKAKLPHWKSLSSVEEHFPCSHVEDFMGYTRDGDPFLVVEFAGKDMQGLSSSVSDALFLGRKHFFESLPTEIVVYYHSHRIRTSGVAGSLRYSNPISQKIGQRWNAPLARSYRTEHYLILLGSPDTIFDQVALATKRKEAKTTVLEQKLRNTAENIKAQLKEYSPRLLKGDEIASYFSWLLNGRPCKARLGANGEFDDMLSSSDLVFPSRASHMLYVSPNSQLYSRFFYIKVPPSGTDTQMLEGLYRLRRKISLYQTFSLRTKHSAQLRIDDARKNIRNFKKYGGMEASACDDASINIESGVFSMLRHRWILEVFGASPEDLEDAVYDVASHFAHHGIQLAAEKMNRACCFWFRYPGYHKLFVRGRDITTENAPHLMTLSSAAGGLRRCSWGEGPVAFFRTEQDNAFGFTFHSEAKKNALGHTMIIGGSGEGKTTLITFLISQAMKYPNMKALCFDSKHGMEVATRFHDGAYVDTVGIGKDVQINPLQLDDTSENRTHLAEWFKALTGRDSDQDKEAIAEGIDKLFSISKRDRNLGNVAHAFGTREANSFTRALDDWMPDGDFGKYFNGRYDVLDFGTSPWVTLDMTTLLDFTPVLGPFCSHVFHKLELATRGDGGYLVFMDEFQRYMQAPQFIKPAERLIRESRKTDGVVVLAIQDVKALFQHPFGDVVNTNTETYIFFPAPGCDEEMYQSRFNLTDRELEFVTRPQTRRILVKHKHGASIVLNVDLKPALGSYLNIFDSGADARNLLVRAQEKYPEHWRKYYLQQAARR